MVLIGVRHAAEIMIINLFGVGLLINSYAYWDGICDHKKIYFLVSY